MDIFWLRRRLFLVIVVLVILNLATLLMLWLGRPDRPAPPAAGRGPEKEQAQIERLLKDELGFDQTQIQEYLRVRRQHREQIKSLDSDIRQLKRQMFDEVLRDQPEPMLSDSLLALTQEKQVLIERLTFQQLLDLKRLCKPEQREKLRLLIHELFRGKPAGDEPSAPPRPPPSNERTPPPSGDEPPPPPPR